MRVKATIHRRAMARRKLLKDEIDELFADLWQVSRLSGLRHGFRPQLDCFRTDDPPLFTVVMDIAGIEPARVNVTAAGRALTISGERPREEREGRVYQQMEVEYGPFERVVQLPEDVDLSQADAQYERGLLTIVMPVAPKPAAAQRVPIEIRGAGRKDTA
jgi:HSP20 family protein